VKTATVLIVITPIGTETVTNQVDTTTDGGVVVLLTPDIHTRNGIIDIMIEEVLVLRPLENPGSLHHGPSIPPWTLLLLQVCSLLLSMNC
jgi:hypothetical protein